MLKSSSWETGRSRRTFAAVFAILLIFVATIGLAITGAGRNCSQLAGAGRPWRPIWAYAIGTGVRGFVMEAFGRAIRVELQDASE